MSGFFKMVNNEFGHSTAQSRSDGQDMRFVVRNTALPHIGGKPRIGRRNRNCILLNYTSHSWLCQFHVASEFRALSNMERVLIEINS
jgi:hypothetical protein